MNKQQSLSLGSRGEKAAIEYLKKLDYKILDVNFCNQKGRRIGEIDIVASDNNEIVFVEVKTRRQSKGIILPEENITRAKLYKINKAAAFYLASNKLHGKPYRFDAITLMADIDNNSAKLRHLKNIFY